MIRGIPIAQAIFKYYKDAHGLEMKVLRPVAGSPLRVRFIAQMDSMDAFRSLQLKAGQDSNFQKLLAEIGPLVDGSKTIDEIWQ